MTDEKDIKLEKNNEKAADMAKVEAQAAAKLLRGRVDDYIAIITAVSAVALLWLLQFLGFY
jgi:hypothetical protein